jgi:hypothetical protein
MLKSDPIYQTRIALSLMMMISVTKKIEKKMISSGLILERAPVPVAHIFLGATLKNFVLCLPGTLRIVTIFIIQNFIFGKKLFLVIY